MPLDRSKLDLGRFHARYIEAQGHGTGSEQELLMPVVAATASYRTATTVIVADASYYSCANVTGRMPGSGSCTA